MLLSRCLLAVSLSELGLFATAEEATLTRDDAPSLPEGYAGEKTCAPCHQQIYESFKQLGMGRSWRSPASAEVVEDFSKNNTFYHAKSGFHYTMLRQNGKLIQKRHLLGSNKQPVDVHEEEVSYIVGSGNHARTYLRHHSNGTITQLPVTWYSQAKRWGMSPGYDLRSHLDFSRAIPHNCVFCHTAYPRLQTEQIEDSHYFPNRVPEGIGCERCHGPGQAHVRFASQGQQRLRQAIYNPSRDTKEAQRMLCYQCHMEVSVDSVGTRVIKPGQDLFSFRPGQPFSQYAIQFSTERSDTEDLRVVQHAELMEESRCFRASGGRMTCTSCHDPHRKVASKDAPGYYRQRCLECHEGGKLSRHTAAQLSGDCNRCHMPRGVPPDGGHTVFTNHRVGIYSKPRPPTPRSSGSANNRLIFQEADRGLSENEKTFFLGAAYLDAPVGELSARLDLARRGVQLLHDYLSKVAPETVSPLYLSRAEGLLGKGYQALNEPARAMNHYENSLKLNDTQLQPAYNLGLLYADRGKVSRSERYFAKVLQRFPEHVPSIHGLGALAEAAGRPLEAMQYFEQAIRLFPNWLASHYRLAQIHLRSQADQKAVLELQKCLSWNPNYLPALMDLGHLFSRQNKLDESRNLFERALKLDESREEVYNALSVVAGLQGDAAQALTVLRRAVTKGVAGEMTYMSLGNLYARRENFPQAIRFFDLAGQKNPGNPKILFALGISHLKMGNRIKGRALLERVLEIDPQNQDAKQVLKELTRP